METNQFDHVIIGGGFAGLAAAKFVCDQGGMPLVVARNGGATQHFSGAFDLLDPRLVQASLAVEAFSLPETVHKFCAANPKHFYAQHLHTPQDVRKLLHDMRAVLAFYGVPMLADGEEAVWTIGSMGHPKPSALAWQTQGLTSAQWRACRNVLVLGFAGVLDYPTQMVAKNLSAHFARVAFEEISEFPVMAASPYVSLLRGFSAPEMMQRYVDLVRTRCQDYDLVIVPPVLSAQDSLALAEGCGGRVCEMLAVLPSLAGLRWQEAVAKTSARLLMPHWQGSVVNMHQSVDAQMVTSIDVRQGERMQRVAAKRWILATGKFAGGGIQQSQEQFFEPLLNLPLFADHEPQAKHTHITRLLHSKAMAPQPFLNLGVQSQSAALPQNVSVCGHLLTGFDFTREHSGFGVSVLSAQKAVLAPM